MDEISRLVIVYRHFSWTMLEDFNDVSQVFIYQNCVIVWSLTLIKLYVLQNIVHEVLRCRSVVFGKFKNKRTPSNLPGPVLIAL